MEIKSSLMPRFTIRTLLVILTLSALVFVMIGTAHRGQIWAWGVTIAIVSMIITSLTHIAWFGIASLLARMPSLQPATMQPAHATLPVDAAGGHAAESHIASQPAHENSAQ